MLYLSSFSGIHNSHVRKAIKVSRNKVHMHIQKGNGPYGTLLKIMFFFQYFLLANIIPDDNVYTTYSF